MRIRIDATEKDLFVARGRGLTGMTARQLQLWDAGGLLTPTVRPHRTAAGGFTERRYTPIELFELIVLADLRRRGFSIHAAPHDPAHSEGAIRSAAVRRHRRRRIRYNS